MTGPSCKREDELQFLIATAVGFKLCRRKGKKKKLTFLKLTGHPSFADVLSVIFHFAALIGQISH